MSDREALLDSGLRTTLILMLSTGAAGSAGFLGPAAAEVLLAVIGVAGIAVALCCGNVFGDAASFFGSMLAVADHRVSDLLMRQVLATGSTFLCRGGSRTISPGTSRGR